jgi:hypothetical protein
MVRRTLAIKQQCLPSLLSGLMVCCVTLDPTATNFAILDDIVPHSVDSQGLYSLFSRIRRLMSNLPAPHLALARDCASLIRRQTTSRDLGRNIVCVVAPCFASYLFSILPAGLQPVVTYIWASTVVSHFMYPLGLDCKPRPLAQVTVVDALGNSLTFPWDACESITVSQKPSFTFASI